MPVLLCSWWVLFCKRLGYSVCLQACCLVFRTGFASACGLNVFVMFSLTLQAATPDEAQRVPSHLYTGSNTKLLQQLALQNVKAGAAPTLRRHLSDKLQRNMAHAVHGHLLKSVCIADIIAASAHPEKTQNAGGPAPQHPLSILFKPVPL